MRSSRVRHRNEFVCKTHRPYKTKAMAEARVKHLREQPGMVDPDLLHAFLCEGACGCSHWHVGHKPDWMKEMI